jgi:hypothetical protein
MIAKETLPCLQWPTLPRNRIDRNRGLHDIDAQFEQFAVKPPLPLWFAANHVDDTGEIGAALAPGIEEGVELHCRGT